MPMKNCTAITPNVNSIKPPVYKRQRFLLAFIQQIPDSVTSTELQKLVFLYSMNRESEHYSFIPYRYGAYSYQLSQDVEILEKSGHLSISEKRIKATNPSTEKPYIKVIEPLRGNALIKKAYSLYPYYAINSEIAAQLMSPSELQTIQNARNNLSCTKETLFTIGYEGKTIETFVNILIQNDIHVLCDVRMNPLSRKFGFSGSKLKHIVETAGIRYTHVPELGIEANKRQGLDSQEAYDALFASYRDSLPNRRVALDTLYETLILYKRIALMCYEMNPACCHRTQIKNYLVGKYKTESSDI